MNKHPLAKILNHSEGYILEYAPEHRKAHNGYVYQHVLVWERTNNAEVPDGYVVHHKDENRANNDPSNLEVLSAEEHKRLHILDRAKEMQLASAAVRKANRTHCAKGHEYTEANTIQTKEKRICRTCRNEIQRNWRAKQRA